MTGKMTWRQVVWLEPRLQALFDEAKAMGAVGESFCANSAWYGYDAPCNGIKHRMSKLVGYGRPAGSVREVDKLLQSHEAYDIAYETIYEQLPDCRNCTCISIG